MRYRLTLAFLAVLAGAVEAQQPRLDLVGVVRPYGTAMACFEWTSEGWIDAVILDDTIAAAERGYFDVEELFYRPSGPGAVALNADSVVRLPWEDLGPWGYMTDMVVPPDIRPRAAINMSEPSHYFVTDTVADAPFVGFALEAQHEMELTELLDVAAPPQPNSSQPWIVTASRATLGAVTLTYVGAERFLVASSCLGIQAMLDDRGGFSVIWQGGGDCERQTRREPYSLLRRGGELFVLFDAIGWDWINIELWGVGENGAWRPVMTTCAI